MQQMKVFFLYFEKLSNHNLMSHCFPFVRSVFSTWILFFFFFLFLFCDLDFRIQLFLTLLLLKIFGNCLAIFSAEGNMYMRKKNLDTWWIIGKNFQRQGTPIERSIDTVLYTGLGCILCAS